MTESEVIDILQDKGAILTGHFVLSSGRHSKNYIQGAQVLQYPKVALALANEISKQFSDTEVDVVASPAIGGITLGFAVAQALDVRSIFAERKDGKMSFRRGFSIRPDEKVLVVEDVVTTGGSVKELIDLIRSEKGGVVGVASLIDRGEKKVFDVPLKSLATVEVESYLPEDCPLCRDEIPLVAPGSKDFKV